ncbi:MAG: hypothetical protein JW741_24245 [Sedimentisphaerales bacterium]|nr:hypothetical protein [Sedimentisphaerales bacterium]
MRADASRRRNRTGPAHTALRIAALWFFSGLCGCAALSYLPPEKLPYARLTDPYNRTQLKTSTTLDVLNLAQAPSYQLDPGAVGKLLLSQSDTAAALTGQSKNGLKTWANIIVFDEYQLTARRKYFFCSDERAIISPTEPKHYLIPPRKGLLFDAELVLDPQFRTTPYATEETRQLAIIRWLAEQINADVRALTGSAEKPAHANELVSLAGMMMNQVFRGLLIELDKSLGLTRSLAEPRGVAFPHVSLDTGHIQLLVQDDVAAVKIRVNLPMLGLR